MACTRGRRSFSATRLRWLLAAALAATLAWGPAMAQTRSIPDQAKRGHIRHVQSLLVSIDATTISLSPGSHIRDTNNFIIVPTALPAAGALADYLVDVNGQVHRVWLLTAQEAAVPRKSDR